MFIFNEKTSDSYNSVSRDCPSEPTSDEIANEWNHNVLTRARELEMGIDNTYIDVIVPNIHDALCRLVSPKAKVLDIGCGLGHLTNLISKSGYDVIGIDIAEKAVYYAKDSFPNVKFKHTSIVEFSGKNTDSFDVCVANMVLHNLVDINSNLLAMYQLLRNGGYVIALIPDPRLWFNKHVKNENLHFDYTTNMVYKIPFKIRNGAIHPSLITYIHRPISQYNHLIENAGFEVIESEHPRLGNGQLDQDLLLCVWRK